MHDIDWIRYPATHVVPIYLLLQRNLCTMTPRYFQYLTYRPTVGPPIPTAAKSGTRDRRTPRPIWSIPARQHGFGSCHFQPPLTRSTPIPIGGIHFRPIYIYIYITRDLLLTADIPYCTQNPVFEISGLLSDKWTVSQRGGFIRRSLPYITPVLRLLARGQ